MHWREGASPSRLSDSRKFLQCVNDPSDSVHRQPQGCRLFSAEKTQSNIGSGGHAVGVVRVVVVAVAVRIDVVHIGSVARVRRPHPPIVRGAGQPKNNLRVYYIKTRIFPTSCE